MQRKNNILIPLKSTVGSNFRGISKNRKGFALIMAITVIVIISTIMALSLSLTSQTTKRTTDLYIYEQAVLYSKSAAELALLDIANEGCIPDRNYTFGGYYIAEVKTSYVYTEANTNVAGTYNCPEQFSSYISTPEQNGSVSMDITLSIDQTQNISSEPIRYFRRVIQKL